MQISEFLGITRVSFSELGVFLGFVLWLRRCLSRPRCHPRLPSFRRNNYDDVKAQFWTPRSRHCAPFTGPHKSTRPPPRYFLCPAFSRFGFMPNIGPLWWLKFYSAALKQSVMDARDLFQSKHITHDEHCHTFFLRNLC